MISRRLMILALLICSMPAVAMKNSADGRPDGEPAAKRPRVWDTVLQGKPLHNAYQKKDIFEFWLAAESGANPDEMSDRDGNPIIITTQLGGRFTEEEIEAAYEILVSKRANVKNAHTSYSGMGLGHIWALEGNNKMMTKALSSTNSVEQTLDPNHKDFDGATPIFYTHKPKVAQTLWRAGACLDAQDDRLSTPLHGVATTDPEDMRMAELYVKLNPHLVSKTNHNGETAFHYAERAFGNPNPALKNPDAVRPLIVGGVNGVFASHQMGNPIVADRNRQTGKKNFQIRQIKENTD